jgi:hypothetical protein
MRSKSASPTILIIKDNFDLGLHSRGQGVSRPAKLYGDRFYSRKVGIGTGYQRVTPMTATNDLQSAVDKILTEIDELNEEIDLVPKIITKQLNYSEDF